MIQRLNNEIREVKEKMRNKEKWEVRLKQAMSNLEVSEQKRRELKFELEKEQKDVGNLEGLSVASIFYSITGQKLEKLDKEKQELMTARLKFQEAFQTVEDLKEECKELQQKISTVHDIERQYNNILKRKEELIIDQNSFLSEELYKLIEKEADLNSNVKEYEEAIDAGKKTCTSLEGALQSLEKAKGWSTFDMLGGGMISTAIKHSHIDDSRDEIHHAQRNLRLFQDELKDVNTIAQANLDISGLLTFADYFFDGIIADWFVHGHIQDSYEQTSQTLNQVDGILTKLRAGYKEIKNKLSMTEQERISFIENMN